MEMAGHSTNMCLSLIRRFGGSLRMSDKIGEAQALAKRCKKYSILIQPHNDNE